MLATAVHFVIAYTLIHIIFWVQICCRIPVDMALVPFAPLAVAAVVSKLGRDRHV